ncbi:MAG: hypothetical protein NZ866_03000, partial [Patescibacteria group bacterium]|nr:hypothetical protein [Patescibacteria group bacterium]
TFKIDIIFFIILFILGIVLAYKFHSSLTSNIKERLIINFINSEEESNEVNLNFTNPSGLSFLNFNLPNNDYLLKFADDLLEKCFNSSIWKLFEKYNIYPIYIYFQGELKYLVLVFDFSLGLGSFPDVIAQYIENVKKLYLETEYDHNRRRRW